MSKSDAVYRHVKGKIEYIFSLADQGTGKAMLANLRRGIGKEPGELWGMIFERMPDEIIDANTEWAVYTALTLYALHQQGGGENVHAEDVSFGSAARALVQDEADRDRILKRLNLVATASPHRPRLDYPPQTNGNAPQHRLTLRSEKLPI